MDTLAGVARRIQAFLDMVGIKPDDGIDVAIREDRAAEYSSRESVLTQRRDSTYLQQGEKSLRSRGLRGQPHCLLTPRYQAEAAVTSGDQLASYG